MSRVGNQPIAVPSGVTINISNGEIQVKGPKGQLSCAVPDGIGAKVEGEQLILERPDDRGAERSRKVL